MALLKYFAKSKSLPDPNGLLSSKLKPETIDSANRKVSALLASTGTSSAKDDGSGQRSRGSYMKFTPEQKAQVARYALESGNMQVIVKYSKQWGVHLKERKDCGSQSKCCQIKNKDEHCRLETNWTQHGRLMWITYEN